MLRTNPFAALVALALKGTRTVVSEDRAGRRKERFPDVFVDKIDR